MATNLRMLVLFSVSGLSLLGCRVQGAVELAPFSGGEGVGGGEGGEISQLLESSRALLSHRNRQLLEGGRAVALAPPERVSASLRMRLVREGEILRSRSARLAELGEAYTGFRTDVRLIDAKRGRDRLVARIEETTSFDYARTHGDEPERTAFRVERLFTFVPSHGTWEIDNVKLADPRGLSPINEATESSITPWR